MKHIILLIVCTICLLLTSLCFSEYYHYIDDGGTTHFTSDYSNIPEQYKSRIWIEESIPSPVIEKNKTDEEDEETDKINEEIKNRSITLKALLIQKDELDTQRQAILVKKDKLIQQQKTMSPEEFNRLVTEVNDEIIAFQNKSNEYEMQVEEYNRQNKQPSEE